MNDMNTVHPTQNQVELWLERHHTVEPPTQQAAHDALSRRLLVLAGDKGRARELCRRFGYNPHSVHIITSPQVLRGLNLDATWTILRGEGWATRPDLDQIHQNIQICCVASGEKPRVVDLDSTCQEHARWVDITAPAADADQEMCADCGATRLRCRQCGDVVTNPLEHWAERHVTGITRRCHIPGVSPWQADTRRYRCGHSIDEEHTVSEWTMNDDQAHEIIEAGVDAAQDCGCGPGEDSIIAAALRKIASMTATGSAWTTTDLFNLADHIDPPPTAL